MYIYWEERGAEVAEMEAVVTDSSDHFKTCSQIEKKKMERVGRVKGDGMLYLSIHLSSLLSPLTAPSIFFLFYNASVSGDGGINVFI